jgi:hypothetical protein
MPHQLALHVRKTIHSNALTTLMASTVLVVPTSFAAPMASGIRGTVRTTSNSYFSQGNSFTDCYQQSPGVAACEKNCLIVGRSGNINGMFTRSDCIPAVPTTTALPTSTASISSSWTTATVTSYTHSVDPPYIIRRQGVDQLRLDFPPYVVTICCTSIHHHN